MDRKAVSLEVTTILLILVAMAVGVVVYAYADGWFGFSTVNGDESQIWVNSTLTLWIGDVTEINDWYVCYQGTYLRGIKYCFSIRIADKRSSIQDDGRPFFDLTWVEYDSPNIHFLKTDWKVLEVTHNYLKLGKIS